MSINFRAYYELTKPRVVMLMLLTALVGMFLAVPGLPPIPLMLWGLIGIGLSAGGAAVINHLVDERFDAIMRRTQSRPLPTGQVKPIQALIFAVLLSIIGLSILIFLVNPLTAVLTFFSLIGYAVIYTIYLKHATPQNIVIGGLAGAMPPLLGWCAITNNINPNALLLVLIIFVWTPPHFWALAIHRHKEYQNVAIPMLPVTHGIEFTKLSVFLYTILLIPVSLLPFVFGMASKIYLIGTTALDIGFLYWVCRLTFGKHPANGIKTFWYSIWYLMILFVVLLVDHYYFLG
jgi:protoheme IX farnesyltransferase